MLLVNSSQLVGEANLKDLADCMCYHFVVFFLMLLKLT